MTAAEFRRLALSLPEAEEREHMHHPDFRVGGKIFATLGYPDKGWGDGEAVSGSAGGVRGDEPEDVRTGEGRVGREGRHQCSC